MEVFFRIRFALGFQPIIGVTLQVFLGFFRLVLPSAHVSGEYQCLKVNLRIRRHLPTESGHRTSVPRFDFR